MVEETFSIPGGYIYYFKMTCYINEYFKKLKKNIIFIIINAYLSMYCISSLIEFFFFKCVCNKLIMTNRISYNKYYIYIYIYIKIIYCHITKYMNCLRVFIF